MNSERPRVAGIIASGPALVVAVVIAATNTPGYSSMRDTVSRLGSPGQPWAPFVRISFVLYGLVVLLGAGALARTRVVALVSTVALQAYAVAAVIAGIAPKDMPGAPHTSASRIHVLATIIGGVAVIAAMAIRVAADDSPSLRWLSAAAALLTVVATIAFRFTWGSRYYGAIECALLLPPVAWVSTVAGYSWDGVRT